MALPSPGLTLVAELWNSNLTYSSYFRSFDSNVCFPTSYALVEDVAGYPQLPFTTSLITNETIMMVFTNSDRFQSAYRVKITHQTGEFLSFPFWLVLCHDQIPIIPYTNLD